MNQHNPQTFRHHSARTPVGLYYGSSADAARGFLNALPWMLVPVAGLILLLHTIFG